MSKIELIKILVVDPQKENVEAIGEMLSNIEYIEITDDAANSQEALDILENYSVDMVLIDASVGGDGYKLAERIAGEYPDIPLIMIEKRVREETLRKAIFAGAVDVIIKPFTPERLIGAIYQSYQQEKKKKHLQQARKKESSTQGKKGQIITIFSTKGGVGKTFVATNLSVSLAKEMNENVVLVDLDLDFGNAALALNIVPYSTITDIINEIRNLDQDMMESCLSSHNSGIKILASGTQPQQSEFISAGHVETILKMLQGIFSYVVVDMPARFHETIMPAFKLADMSILVVTPDVAAVRNIKSGMMMLQELGYPKSKIKLLLNKEDSRGEIKSKDVQTTLNHNLYFSIPVDYKIAISSLNRGEPVSVLYPRSKINNSFVELARKIAGNNQKNSDEKVT